MERDRLREVNAELLKALDALIVQWDLFTGPQRQGWGNMEDAYYDLAKHAQNAWKNARTATAKAREQKG